MKNSVNILNFDQTYQVQTYYEKTDYKWIDLSDIRNTNCYCEKKSLISIYDRLKKSKKSRITFIGSGNYHYVTYLLLADVQSPFTLVLFDHHTDMFKSPYDTLISCGSWVLNALETLPMLKKIIIVGTSDDLVESIPPYYNKRLSVFSKEQTEQTVGLNKYINSAILTENVYISIDKDVLMESEAVTNWNQGNMKLTQLLNLIDNISTNKKICGIDVCGEYFNNPTTSFYKESFEAIQINNKANLTILNTITKLRLQIN